MSGGGFPIVPPPRFACVEPGVFRSGYPTLRHFNFLRSLELKLIVCISPEEPTVDLREFCRSERVSLRNVCAEKYKGTDAPMLPTDAASVLDAMVSASVHPVLVCCLDGRAVTGTAVLLLRKLQMWSSAAAHSEYCRFTAESAPAPDVVSFIADFVTPIVLPVRIPRWLWGGSL